MAVSLVSLVGLVTISMNEMRVRGLATFFVSFAIGALLVLDVLYIKYQPQNSPRRLRP